MAQHRQAIKFLAIVAFLFSVVFIWYFVNFTMEERDVYEKITQEINEIEEVTTRCLVSNREIKGCQAGFISMGSACVACAKGTFSLEGWSACKELLTCNDIHQDVRPSKLLYTLGNWRYSLAEWKGYEVLHAKMTSSETEVNFKALSEVIPGSSKMLYSIGSCESSGTVIFNHDVAFSGPAFQLDSILKQRGCDHWVVRFNLVMNYVQILSHLHAGTDGPYVLCNSHTLHQVLSQFLITEDLQLVLANFDNLPQITSRENLVKCSKVELSDSFVAPEQHWPYTHHKVFNWDEQPSYDEKTDIWKIPQVAREILGSSDESEWIVDYLMFIFDECKNKIPMDRPGAEGVMIEFEAVKTLVTGSLDYHYNYDDYNAYAQKE